MLLLALKATQSDDLGAILLPGDDKGQMIWLKNVAMQIVSFCWEGETAEDVRVVKITIKTPWIKSDGQNL